jgi:hypothetical protein
MRDAAISFYPTSPAIYNTQPMRMNMRTLIPLAVMVLSTSFSAYVWVLREGGEWAALSTGFNAALLFAGILVWADREATK